jgi:hemolysin D
MTRCPKHSLAQDVIKAEQRTKLQRLTAPVDGVVRAARRSYGWRRGDACPAARGGGSDRTRLEIETRVSNRDIGFVHSGQNAKIKVDTFNLARYGLLHAEVLGVSVRRHYPRQATERAE